MLLVKPLRFVVLQIELLFTMFMLMSWYVRAYTSLIKYIAVLMS